MKKLLSILLVISMFVSSCILFTGCDKVKLKDIESKPYETITVATQKTMAQFFTDDTKIGKTIKQTMYKGATTVSFESKSLLDEIGIKKISDTVYSDVPNKKTAHDILVNYYDENLSARLFVDKNGILINSEDILNNKNTYGIFPETLASKFKTSVFASTLFEGQNLDEIVDILEEFRDVYKEAFENNEENEKAEFIKITNLLKQQIFEEEIDKNDYIVIKYEISNSTLKSIYDEYKNDLIEEAPGFNDPFAELDESAEIYLSVKSYLNKKTALYDKTVISGFITQDKTNSIINACITYAADKMTFDFSVVSGKDEASLKSVLNKEITDSTVKYVMDMTVRENDVSKEIKPFTYTYTKESGDFTVDLDLRDLVDDKEALITLSGNLKNSAEDAEITIKSIKYDLTTIFFDLTFKFEPNKSMPETPAEAKDVIDLTEDDLMNIMEGIQNSKLGKAIEKSLDEY